MPGCGLDITCVAIGNLALQEEEEIGVVGSPYVGSPTPRSDPSDGSTSLDQAGKGSPRPELKTKSSVASSSNNTATCKLYHRAVDQDMNVRAAVYA